MKADNLGNIFKKYLLTKPKQRLSFSADNTKE